MGNKSNVTIKLSTPSIYVGNKYPNIPDKTYQGSVASADYDSNFRTYAAQLYYKYKSKLFNIEECLFAYRFIELSI